jgi:hypothetical protein
LSNISPKWARRLGERQELPVPMSITWLRRYFELKSASKCVVEEAHRYLASYMYDCRECDEIGWRFMPIGIKIVYGNSSSRIGYHDMFYNNKSD